MSNPNPSQETRFQPGKSGNPGGRPKDTLKQYIARKLSDMSDSEKEEFLSEIPKDMQWRMGEGNPAQETDLTSGGEKVVPIFGGLSVHQYLGNDKDIQIIKKD